MIKREADTTIHPLGKRQKNEKIDEGNHELNCFLFYDLLRKKMWRFSELGGFTEFTWS